MLAVSVFAVTLGVSLSGCSGFGGASPSPSQSASSPEASASASASESPSSDPSETATETASASDAADAAEFITDFFAAVKSDTKTVLAAAPDGKYDPKLATFDQDYSSAYSYIDRNSVNTTDAAKLVYAFGTVFAAQPNMSVSVAPEDVSMKNGEAYISGGNITLEMDGKTRKSESVDSGAFFLHKVGGKWLISYVDMNDGTK